MEDNRDSANYAQFKEDLFRSLSVDTKVDEETFKVENEQKLAESVFAESMEAFKRKTAKIKRPFPSSRRYMEEQGDRYGMWRFLLPTDSRFTIPCQSKGCLRVRRQRKITKVFERAILLHTIDDYWKEHLREMDDLRSRFKTPATSKKDPLWFTNSRRLTTSTKKMIDDMNQKAVAILMRMQIYVPDPQQMQEAAPEEHETSLNIVRAVLMRPEEGGPSTASGPATNGRVG